MSGALIAVAGAFVSELLLSTPRNIGTIIPDVVVEELSDDRLQTTDHPVELGADITDHAFKEAPQVEISAAWSDVGKFPGYSRAMLAALRTLQASRNPMQISTGKISYQSMLITGISVRTDVNSPSSLMANIRCKQIVLVMVTSTTVPPRDVQANPATTAPTSSTGDVQPVPVTLQQNQSLLYQGSQAGLGFLGNIGK